MSPQIISGAIIDFEDHIADLQFRFASRRFEENLVAQWTSLDFAQLLRMSIAATVQHVDHAIHRAVEEFAIRRGIECIIFDRSQRAC